jgi:hypothetical protein
MRYAIDVLDHDRARVSEMTGIVSARLHEKVNTPALLVVETETVTDWEAVIPGGSYLRLREKPDGPAGTFRVIEALRRRDRERPGLTFTARHLLGDTTDELVAAAVDCINYTPAELADLVLGFSSFGRGVVEPVAGIPYVRFEYESVLDCLLRICSLCGAELSVDEDGGRIDLLGRIGGDAGAVFRYGLTLKRASRRVNVGGLANRVYGIGGGNPPLDLRGSTDSAGKPYVEDAESVLAWGVLAAAYHDPTLEDTVNLVAAPAFDGVYTDGVCEGWTNAGADAGRNTAPEYFLYGLASQRVRSSAPGQGMYQNVAVVPGRVYSLLANIILANGTVRVQVEDGNAVYRRQEPVTGAGLAVVRIENWKALTPEVTVRIMQEGDSPAEFYADSVQISEGSSSKPFTVGRSADTLRERTLEYLAAHKDPEITYEVELAETTPKSASAGALTSANLGDTVRVIDPVLGIDVRTRVMERDMDVLRPGRVKVKLDSPSRGLADVLAALRKAQDEGIRHTRAALAESSTAAETGSTRLGFSNLSFRFSGSIAAAGFDAVGWSAGTLRVGDAWFAIDAGAVSGLGGSSTFYFFFDRMSPATFGYVASSAEAEGEDRILLFAVTTTAYPDTCVVHPLAFVSE